MTEASFSGTRDCNEVLCATCSPVTSSYALFFFFLQLIYRSFLHNAGEKESITASRRIQQEKKREKKQEKNIHEENE